MKHLPRPRRRLVQTFMLAILLGISSFCSRAQLADDTDLKAVEASTPTAAEDLPVVGMYYSASNPAQTPMPGNFYNLAAWDLGGGFYLLSDLDYQPQSSFGMRRRDDDSGPPSPPGDGGDGGGTNSSGEGNPFYGFATNNLWMQITGITNGIVSINLNNATNLVYEIFSTDSLTNPVWNIEQEVWPDTNQNPTPFTVPVLDRTNNLFFYARDWTGITSNGNETPSWWFFWYFGTTDLSDTNLDAAGETLLYDYTYVIDPNVISFSLNLTNQFVHTATVPMQINVTAGLPSFMAVLVDDTNSADADWIPYHSSLTAPIGTSEGWHQIWVGLRGLPPTAQETWVWCRVKLDLTPPLLVVTNPSSSTVLQPMIEVQGYCAEPLLSLQYDLSNAAGFFTNQPAFVLNQSYTTNTWEFTTNTFQAFDVPLTNGDNVLTFHAADLAGNLTTTNFTYTLSYAGRTNPPVTQCYWPLDGTQISGSAFTWRGSVDDFTTTLQATITDTNGDTNTVSALVERDGNFWVENLPLAAGSNQLTLTATDAAGNITTTNLTVMGSSTTLTMNAVDSSLLWQFTASVGGNVSDPACSVWVNGVQGTNNGDGTWSATNVPITPGGTAVFQARAIASSDHGGNGSGGGGTATYADLGNPNSATARDVEMDEDKPPRLYVSQYTMALNTSSSSQMQNSYYVNGGFDFTATTDSTGSSTWNCTWGDQQGGSGSWTTTFDSDGDSGGCTGQDTWPASFWPTLADGSQTFSGSCNPALDNDAGSAPVLLEHCEVNIPTNTSDGPYWEYSTYIDILESQTYDANYARQAQTTMQFDTGGKGVPGEQSLYLFTALATDMLSTNPIPPETISIGGLGNLDTNGDLWVALPNGNYGATPKVPGKQYVTYSEPSPPQYNLVHTTQCTATGNPDDTRTTIGIGETVYLTGMPGNTIWTNSGGGSIDSTNGAGTTFTASLSPVGGTVTAKVGTAAPLSVTFNVIAPDGFKTILNSSPGLGASGSNNIGQLSIFNVDVTPSTVSFYNVAFRENFPYTNVWTWPDGTSDGFNPSPKPWDVSCDNFTIDDIKDGPYPKGHIYNGTKAWRNNNLSNYS